jgi:hypothetical protein
MGHGDDLLSWLASVLSITGLKGLSRMSQKRVSGVKTDDFPNMKKRPPDEKEAAWELKMFLVNIP